MEGNSEMLSGMAWRELTAGTSPPPDPDPARHPPGPNLNSFGEFPKWWAIPHPSGRVPLQATPGPQPGTPGCPV